MLKPHRLRLQVAYLFIWAGALATNVAFAQVPGGASPELPVDPMQAVNQALQLIETGGDLRQADRLIRDASLVNPDLSRIKLARGLLSMAVNRYGEAIESLEQYNVTNEGRRDHRGYAAVGRVYLQSRMYMQAAYPLEKAMEIVPRDLDDGAAMAAIAIDLARSNLGVGKQKEAAEAIKQAQATASKNGEIQTAVCELAAAANDTPLARQAGDTAIKIFLAELRDNPLSESAHSEMLKCYRVLFSIKNAELQSDPSNGAAFADAADLLRSLSDIERRIRMLSARSLVLQALESNPSKKEWLLSAAGFEIELDALVDANRRIDTVLESDPDNAEAKRLKETVKSLAG